MDSKQTNFHICLAANFVLFCPKFDLFLLEISAQGFMRLKLLGHKILFEADYESLIVVATRPGGTTSTFSLHH